MNKVERPERVFLYPQVGTYPVDHVCDRIVRALHIRNWQTSNLEVQFSTFEEKYTYVTEIKGKDFRLFFNQHRGLIDGLTNIVTVSKITIPYKQLRLTDDLMGPLYFTYVGTNWNRDKDTFIYGTKTSSKRDEHPRTYLRYEGSQEPDHFAYLQSRQNRYLINDDNRGLEYRAEGNEPRFFETEKVLQEINEWLTENVLKPLENRSP